MTADFSYTTVSPFLLYKSFQSRMLLFFITGLLRHILRLCFFTFVMFRLTPFDPIKNILGEKGEGGGNKRENPRLLKLLRRFFNCRAS